MQYLSQNVTEARDLDLLAGRIEDIFHPLGFCRCIRFLLVDPLDGIRQFVDFLGQAGVACREFGDERVLASGLFRSPGLRLGQLCLFAAHPVGCLLECFDGGADPGQVELGQVAPCLEKVETHGLAQQFLIQHHDSLAQLLQACFSRPASRLFLFRNLFGGGCCQQRRLDFRDLSLGLLELQADGGRPFLFAVDLVSELRQLGLDTLCTNRDLPLQLALGEGATDFTLEAGIPVHAIRSVQAPTRPRGTIVEGQLAWRLISQLSLNYLSLLDGGEAGSGPIRELLRLYADPSDSRTEHEIDGVRSLVGRRVVDRVPGQGYHTPVRIDDPEVARTDRPADEPNPYADRLRNPYAAPGGPDRSDGYESTRRFLRILGYVNYLLAALGVLVLYQELGAKLLAGEVAKVNWWTVVYAVCLFLTLGIAGWGLTRSALWGWITMLFLSLIWVLMGALSLYRDGLTLFTSLTAYPLIALIFLLKKDVHKALSM